MPRRSARNRKTRSEKDYVNPETIPDDGFLAEIQQTPLKVYSDEEFDSNNTHAATSPSQLPESEQDETDDDAYGRLPKRRRGAKPARVSSRRLKNKRAATEKTMAPTKHVDVDELDGGEVLATADTGDKDGSAHTRTATLEDFIRDHAEPEEETESMLPVLLEVAEQQPEAVPGFNRGRVAAMEALRLNQAMTDQVEAQIQQIDAMLAALQEQKVNEREEYKPMRSYTTSINSLPWQRIA